MEIDEDGDTPLHISIIASDTNAALRCIYLYPESINMFNDENQTPLYLAVCNRLPIVIQKLVDSGADTTMRNKKGKTPLHAACELGFVEEARLLMIGNLDSHDYNGFTPLLLAVLEQNQELVKMLIDGGANINAISKKEGNNALHIACKSKNVQLVKLLLDNGCDGNKSRFDGTRPLDSTPLLEKDIETLLKAWGAISGYQEENE
jgi:ankyrin repeat protein